MVILFCLHSFICIKALNKFQVTSGWKEIYWKTCQNRITGRLREQTFNKIYFINCANFDYLKIILITDTDFVSDYYECSIQPNPKSL